MASMSTWLRYIAKKVDYSLYLSLKGYDRGQIAGGQVLHSICNNVFNGKLTFLHWISGEEMFPKISTHGVTLLVRKILEADPMNVNVRDMVVLKDPANPENYLVRRLAAVEGDEMASTHKKDEPFVLGEDECWVLADNKELKPKEAYDSRTFGPVTITDIVGRAIYYLKDDVDHGPVNNNGLSKTQDLPVLEIELDINEMINKTVRSQFFRKKKGQSSHH